MTRKTKLLTTSLLIITVIGCAFAWHQLNYREAKAIPYFNNDGYMRSENPPSLTGLHVKHNEDGVQVTNKSGKRLDCEIISVSGYFFPNTTLQVDQTFKFPYRDFTLRSIRLDTERVKPDSLSIQCTVAGTNYANRFLLQ